jgi:2-oxoglutarate ferredoxin oxidoreductase subunit alpha
MPNLGDGYKLLITGSTHDEFGWRKTKDGNVHRKLVNRLSEKILANKEKIFKFELKKPKDAKIGLISYGSASRSVNEALSRLPEEEREQLATLRLITLWPFPEQHVKEYFTGLSHVIIPEYNSGLMVREFERFKPDNCDIHRINQIGGGEPILVKTILDKIREVL